MKVLIWVYKSSWANRQLWDTEYGMASNKSPLLKLKFVCHYEINLLHHFVIVQVLHLDFIYYIRFYMKVIEISRLHPLFTFRFERTEWLKFTCR